jgi:hypothetical protein
MAPRTWLRALIFLLFLCFGLGLLSVMLQEDDGSPSAPPTAHPVPIATSVTSAAPAAPGSAILVLGVDDLSKEQPRLLAAWVAAHDTTQDQLLLYGIPISTAAPGTDEVPLAALFRWSREAGLDPEFASALAALAPLPYQATVVMDETAFATGVDVLGGADLGGTRLQGEQVLAFLRILQTNPEALLAAQSEVLLALRPGLQDLGPTPDISRLAVLHPEHVYLSLDEQQLAALVAPMMPFEAASIHVGTLLDQPAP